MHLQRAFTYLKSVLKLPDDLPMPTLARIWIIVNCTSKPLVFETLCDVLPQNVRDIMKNLSEQTKAELNASSCKRVTLWKSDTWSELLAYCSLNTTQDNRSLHVKENISEARHCTYFNILMCEINNHLPRFYQTMGGQQMFLFLFFTATPSRLEELASFTLKALDMDCPENLFILIECVQRFSHTFVDENIPLGCIQQMARLLSKCSFNESVVDTCRLMHLNVGDAAFSNVGAAAPLTLPRGVRDELFMNGLYNTTNNQQFQVSVQCVNKYGDHELSPDVHLLDDFSIEIGMPFTASLQEKKMLFLISRMVDPLPKFRHFYNKEKTLLSRLELWVANSANAPKDDNWQHLQLFIARISTNINTTKEFTHEKNILRSTASDYYETFYDEKIPPNITLEELIKLWIFFNLRWQMETMIAKCRCISKRRAALAEVTERRTRNPPTIEQFEALRVLCCSEL